MLTQKVFAASNESIAFRCPACMKEYALTVKKIQHRYETKVRCNCKALFLLQVEFRKKKRKQVNVEGYFEKGERGGAVRIEQEFKEGRKTSNCRIKNISQNGIGILTDANHYLREGNTLIVAFSLGDATQRSLAKVALVRHVNGNYLGCEFAEADKNDKVIGFFVLS